MKFLDAKRAKGSIANKMLPGPSADKSGPPAEHIPPAGSDDPPGPGEIPPAAPIASPQAARLAAELGIPLGKIQGTGAEGMILVSDVRHAAEPATE